MQSSMRSRLVASVFFVLTLGAGATGAGAQMTPPVPCPPPTMVVVRSDGVTVHYRGVDPADARLCVSSVNGRNFREIYQVWVVDAHTKTGDIAKVYTALTAVLSGPAGTRASIEISGSSRGGNGREYASVWQYTFLNEGTNPISVGGRAHPAIKIHKIGQGTAHNFFSATYDDWLDSKTGALLKSDRHIIRGHAPERKPWTAVSITE